MTPQEVLAPLFDAYDSYFCAVCGHRGGEHRLSNGGGWKARYCMVCDCSHFSDPTEDQRRAHAIAALPKGTYFFTEESLRDAMQECHHLLGNVPDVEYCAAIIREARR